jgi:hypothetical protein
VWNGSSRRSCFADLAGSTELGGSQDPERTRVLLDRLHVLHLDWHAAETRKLIAQA